MLAKVTSCVGSKLRTADMQPVATPSVACNTVAAPLRSSSRPWRRAEHRMTLHREAMAIDRLCSDVHQNLSMFQS